jgi:hypothetical protein
MKVYIKHSEIMSTKSSAGLLAVKFELKTFLAKRSTTNQYTVVTIFINQLHI